MIATIATDMGTRNLMPAGRPTSPSGSQGISRAAASRPAGDLATFTAGTKRSAG
jgi:hypothetical protein